MEEAARFCPECGTANAQWPQNLLLCASCGQTFEILSSTAHTSSFETHGNKERLRNEAQTVAVTDARSRPRRLSTSGYSKEIAKAKAEQAKTELAEKSELVKKAAADARSRPVMLSTRVGIDYSKEIAKAKAEQAEALQTIYHDTEQAKAEQAKAEQAKKGHMEKPRTEVCMKKIANNVSVGLQKRLAAAQGHEAGAAGEQRCYGPGAGGGGELGGAAILEGLLSMKVPSIFDQWPEVLCRYNPTNNFFHYDDQQTTKGRGYVTLVAKVPDRGMGKRANRFDIGLSGQEERLALAAPGQKEMDTWVNMIINADKQRINSKWEDEEVNPKLQFIDALPPHTPSSYIPAGAQTVPAAQMAQANTQQGTVLSGNILGYSNNDGGIDLNKLRCRQQKQAFAICAEIYSSTDNAAGHSIISPDYMSAPPQSASAGTFAKSARGGRKHGGRQPPEKGGDCL
jgi:hypothetical protein